MITIFQGESVAWQCHVEDDNDATITNLQDNRIKIILKSASAKPLYEWDNANMLFGEGGYFGIILTSEATSTLPPGCYGMEAAIIYNNEYRVIAEESRVIRVRPSTIGGMIL